MVLAKLKVAVLHALITLVVVLFVAYVVFVIWYPGYLSEMAAGAELYRLLFIAELVLGPLISLVIYSPYKVRRELVRDYLCVGFIQFSALIYGVYSLYISRPVYLVFVSDRIEIVAAVELGRSDLLGGGHAWVALPWFGPRFVCVEPPSDPQEKSDLILSALEGKDIQLMPRYYRNCFQGEVEARMWSADVLKEIAAEHADGFRVAGYINLYPSLNWLPIVSRFGAWIAIYPQGKLNEPLYVDFNPFDE